MSARPGFMSFLLEALRFVKYAQHDQNIANADGATVRADINNALAALFGLSSGAAAPSTTIAYMLWADTTTGLLKIRNAANSAWVTVGTLASTNLGLLALAGGTMTGNLLFTDATYDIGQSGATRPRHIYQSGNHVIGGTLTVTGGQIAFPATQVPSADANTLDDYEEGTWTPSVGGNATYTGRVGRYTKIGRWYDAECYIEINAIGTGSTTQITGAPFSSGGTGGSSGGVSFFSTLATNLVFIAPRMAGGGSTISFITLTVAAATPSGSAVFGNATRVDFHISVQT